MSTPLLTHSQPYPAQPYSAQPVSAQPYPAQPVSAQPVSVQPVSAQPVSAQPASAQPVSAQPVPAQTASAQPVPAQPYSAQPIPVQPVQMQPIQGQPYYYAVSPQVPQQLVYYQPPYPSVQALPPNPPTYDQSNGKAALAPSPAPIPVVQPAVQPAVYINASNNVLIPKYPCKMYCPNCKKEVNTVINYENNSMIWILVIILFIFTVCLFFIPLMINDLKDVVHYCPHCRREITRREKSI